MPSSHAKPGAACARLPADLVLPGGDPGNPATGRARMWTETRVKSHGRNAHRRTGWRDAHFSSRVAPANCGARPVTVRAVFWTQHETARAPAWPQTGRNISRFTVVI